MVLRLGGHLFLSSTRVIFAAAFDRILPDGAAQVSEKRRVPVWSLVLMLLPAVGLGALYAYNSTFHTYTLDATLVIAVTYLFSAIAVVILPFRKPDLWRPPRRGSSCSASLSCPPPAWSPSA